MEKAEMEAVRARAATGDLLPEVGLYHIERATRAAFRLFRTGETVAASDRFQFCADIARAIEGNPL